MVNATKGTFLNLDPQAVRYDLTATRRGGVYSGSLDLQRAQRTEVSPQVSTWIDDPRKDAARTVKLPASCHASVAALVSLLPQVLSRNIPQITLNSYTDLNLQLESRILPDESLDVSITMAIRTGSQWLTPRKVPSLADMLKANPDLAVAILTAWAGVDAAVNAANAAEGWV